VLTWHFVKRYAHEVGRRITRLEPQTLRAFEAYPWPGNVRQLRNVLRAALILGHGPVLSIRGLDLLEAPPAAGGPGASLQLRDLERTAVFEALRRTRSNQAKAARLLGITDRTLREKLRKYRRDQPDSDAGAERCLSERT